LPSESLKQFVADSRSITWRTEHITADAWPPRRLSIEDMDARDVKAAKDERDARGARGARDARDERDERAARDERAERDAKDARDERDERAARVTAPRVRSAVWSAASRNIVML